MGARVNKTRAVDTPANARPNSTVVSTVASAVDSAVRLVSRGITAVSTSTSVRQCRAKMAVRVILAALLATTHASVQKGLRVPTAKQTSMSAHRYLANVAEDAQMESIRTHALVRLDGRAVTVTKTSTNARLLRAPNTRTRNVWTLLQDFSVTRDQRTLH